MITLNRAIKSEKEYISTERVYKEDHIEFEKSVERIIYYKDGSTEIKKENIKEHEMLLERRAENEFKTESETL